MTEYNFKRYHLKSINAASDEARAAVNKELKDLYSSLPEDEKVIFNEQLQRFLAKEYARLGSDYESIKGGTDN